MYNIDVAREIYKRLLENGVNISLAGIPIVEEVLNEEDERRRTPRALDGATGLCKCDTGYPFATHPICGICGLPRQ